MLVVFNKNENVFLGFYKNMKVVNIVKRLKIRIT